MVKKYFNIPRAELEERVREILAQQYKVVIEPGRDFQNTYNIFVLGVIDGTN